MRAVRASSDLSGGDVSDLRVKQPRDCFAARWRGQGALVLVEEFQVVGQQLVEHDGCRDCAVRAVLANVADGGDDWIQERVVLSRDLNIENPNISFQ